MSKRRQGSAEIGEEEDEEGFSQDDSSQELTHHGSKRARLETSATPEAPLLPDSYRNAPQQKYQPGSIVRVTMKNFVTYTAAEFHPGPSLNMIIGPNGTGKSTLVCAICLGLGFKPEHLGRAKDIAEFVNHDAKEAEIEIELAADPSQHRRNPVIKRQIKKEGSKSTYFINGKASGQKGVSKLVKSFSIQVDNLCQFLPQDRVVEFAALSPVDLLTQTQRAAAPEYMVEWHEELKALRKEQKSDQANKDAQAEQLKQMEGRQNLQRGDVERLRERAELLEKVASLEKMRPFPAYRIAKEQYQVAKERKKLAQEDLQAFQRQVEPALRAVHNKAAYASQIEKVVGQRRKLIERSEGLADKHLKSIEALQTTVEDCDREINAEREGSKKSKADRNRLQQQITATKREMEKDPIDFDPAHYNEQIRELQRQRREIEDSAAEENNQQSECVQRARSLDQRIYQARNRLENLHSQLGQQTNKLQQVSRDTARAWEWIQENKDKFEGEVYAPPVLSCSLKDVDHAKFVESMIPNSELLAFTVTSSRDFKALQQQLYGNLRLHDIYIRSSPQTPMSSYQPPVSDEEMQHLGVDAWVLDLIEGPEPVLAMLCDNRNIHQTAVIFQIPTDENRQYEGLRNSAVSSWVDPKFTVQITRRREYGDQGISARTQRLRNPQFFTNQPVDTQIEGELNANIREWERDQKELAAQAERHKAKSQQFGTQHKQLRDQQVELEREKADKQKAYAYQQSLPARLRTYEDKLKTLSTSLASVNSRIEDIQARQGNLSLEKGQEAINYANTVGALQRLHIQLFEAELLHIESKSDLEVLTAKNAEINELLEQRRREVRSFELEFNRIKQTATELMNECNAIRVGMDEREEELLNNVVAPISPDDLETEIESNRAMLEMVHEGNPAIIQEFEKRGRQIEELRQKIENRETHLNELQERITEIREKWEPELDELVAKISHAFGDNFARINCAGQVQVYKDEDFEQWAIQIQVKFR